ncbi:MAG: geranylgeranyl reductase family protein [Candidatus Helarchaeota archaeon]
MFDVIVIGAGPGGSTAALKLAEKGHLVLLLEKEKLPRYKPCGGAIPQELVDELKLPDTLIERRFNQLVLYHNNLIINRSGKGAVVWRDKFDFYITKKAVNAGITLKDSTSCIGVDRTSNGFKVLTNNGIYQSKFLIASDGSVSTVLKSLGWKKFAPADIALTIQYEMKMSHKLISKKFGENNIHLFFGKKISRRGYGWIFPKRDIISVGWGSQLSMIKNSRIEFENFLNYIKEFINGASLIKKVAHLVPTKSRTILFDNNLFVVGDAAGFVDPLSGKGIPYSMLSGEIAASIISKFFNESDPIIIKKKYIQKLNNSFLLVLKKKSEIQADVYSSDKTIYRFLNLWKEHRSSEIALHLWQNQRS